MEAKVAWVDPTADPALYLYGADPVAKLAAEQAPVCIFYREDLIAAVSIEAIKAVKDAVKAPRAVPGRDRDPDPD